MRRNKSWLLQFRCSCMYFFTLFVFLYVVITLYWIFSQNLLRDTQIAQRETCPACFGESLCLEMERNIIQFRWTSTWNIFDTLVFSGSRVFNENSSTIKIKRLGKQKNFKSLDRRICSEANRPSECDVSYAIYKIKFIRYPEQFVKSLPDLPSPMFFCPSTRLIDKVVSTYKERRFSVVTRLGLSEREKAQIWTTAYLNPEPLLLQTFPQSRGWPFPKYIGSCGRLIFTEEYGVLLSNYYNAPWQNRATMALKLIKIADKLSNNLDDFALYVTDVTLDSFAVNDKGELLLIELDSVLVVDKLAVKGSELKTWNGMHESQFNECRNQTFRECNKDTEPQLCRHVNSDHNYYVICRQLLSQDAYNGSEKRKGFVNGLLHNMPDTARNDWELDYLLSECVMPTRQRGRMQVVHKMIEALSNLQSDPVKH